MEKYQGSEELPEEFWPELGPTPSAHKVYLDNFDNYDENYLFKLRQEPKESAEEYEALMGHCRCQDLTNKK